MSVEEVDMPGQFKNRGIQSAVVSKKFSLPGKALLLVKLSGLFGQHRFAFDREILTDQVFHLFLDQPDILFRKRVIQLFDGAVISFGDGMIYLRPGVRPNVFDCDEEDKREGAEVDSLSHPGWSNRKIQFAWA